MKLLTVGNSNVNVRGGLIYGTFDLAVRTEMNFFLNYTTGQPCRKCKTSSGNGYSVHSFRIRRSHDTECL